MGVRSTDELLAVLNLDSPVKAVEGFRGDEEPNPTGVILGTEGRAPVLMLEDLRTDDAVLGLSSEFKLMFEPVREGGLDPPRDPVAALDRRKDIISSP